MRVLLLIDDYYPSTKSGAKMMHDLGVELLRYGHQVTVVTPGNSLSRDLSVTVEDGVTVARFRAGNLKYTRRALRGLREFRLSSTIWRRAGKFLRAHPCDLIVFYSPTIFFGALVRRLKALWRCPAYLVLRDIFPQWAVDAGVLRKGILYNYLHHKELLQYAAADVIGVEGEGDLRYFHQDLHERSHRAEVLFNWMETRERPQPGTELRRRLGLENKVVFFYGGNIGVAQDIDNILRLAVTLRGREEICFLLMGSGSEAPRLQAEIEKQDLRNIRILPPVPQQEYLKCLAEFDVGVVSLDRRLQTHNSTGKLLGYLLCGKPVLASLNPGNGLARLLHQADAGIACENGDDESLRAAALLLAQSPELRQRMGNNARQLGEARFSVKVAAEQILSHFEPVSAGSRLSSVESTNVSG